MRQDLEPIEYRVIRSDRKSVALQLKGEQILVRAPRSMSEGAIRQFVDKHREWINARQQAIRKATGPLFTDEELEDMKSVARGLLHERLEYYAPIIGVRYNRVTVRCQKTKWGSCSGKGNLNFNCLLAMVPREVLDYVVVHELCHLKQMNHSKKFYREVERVLPDHRARRAWLKKNGGVLMRRAHGGRS